MAPTVGHPRHDPHHRRSVSDSQSSLGEFGGRTSTAAVVGPICIASPYRFAVEDVMSAFTFRCEELLPTSPPPRDVRLDSSPLPLSLRWIDHAPSRRAGALLAALWVLAMADLFFTIWAHRFARFSFAEMNPIAAAMLANGLVSSLIIFKLTVTLFATDIFWRLRGYRRAQLALLAMVIVYVMLALRWNEYTVGAAASLLTTAPSEHVANC
jgi:hypothetical protein